MFVGDINIDVIREAVARVLIILNSRDIYIREFRIIIVYAVLN